MSSNYSKSLRRVSFSPEIQLENPTINRKRPPPVSAGIFNFRLPKTSSSSNYYSPARILRRIGAKVARVVRFVAMRRKQSSSRKVSSSSCTGSCSSTLTRSRSVADHALDSQRAEAIEDCIEFLNSNSSSNYYLQRSNSVSSSISNY